MDQAFKLLKTSPLADAHASVEEVAVWIDMNVSKTIDLIKILKSIDKNYHTQEDDVDDLRAAFSKLCNMLKSSPNAGFPILPQALYFSDRILKSLFKAICQTSALDHLVLSKQFIKYAYRTRDAHRKKIAVWHEVGSGYKVKSYSRIDEDLYEIFAELCDILESKAKSTLQLKNTLQLCVR